MSQSSSLLDEVWAKISNSMKEMFQLRPMTRDDFMVHFNLTHKYFMSSEYNESLLKAALNKPRATNKSEKKGNEVDDDDDQVDTDIPGGEMYFNVKNFLREYLEDVAKSGKKLKGEEFLRFYAKTWEKFPFLSQIVNSLLASLNSNWVKRQRENGVKGIYEVYTTAMLIWQDVFFKDINQSLTQTCLTLIKDERNGVYVDSRLIQQVVQSYVSAGFTDAEKKNRNNFKTTPSLTTYNDYFEKQFLEETIQFYQFESNNYLAENSISDYIKKATQRLAEEERRVKDFLHPTTLEKLKPKLEQILVQNQLDPIYAESIKVLHQAKIEDLHLIFGLVNRIPKGNAPIQEELEKFANDTGMDAINRISSTAIREPKTYVEAIIEVYLRFSNIVKEAFCHEPGYIAALNKACSKFINNNAVTAEAKTSTKSPELLARYCDTLLRKGNKTDESDIEQKLDEIMAVFNYVEDKDVFQKFYGKMLAKRLVGQLSASDDQEGSMISKLKAACGFEYASKLQRMFQDIRLSTTLIEDFKIYYENKRCTDIVDFSVMVLTSHSWPFTAPPPFNLPTELKPTFTSFTQFYSTKFNGRKLEWLHQHSKGELQTLYTKTKHTFLVSTYQMAVLLLFNEHESMTVERMLDSTQIETELFVQVLFNLLKNKILTCSEINVDELDDDFKESDIKRSSTIQVYEGFKSKKVRINLNQPIRSVEQKDSEHVNQSIDDDRKMLIQAAVVRIMKARKELKYTFLLQEVIPQLTARFKPQIPIIKKCIDILIEKEYLERDATQRDLFRYLA